MRLIAGSVAMVAVEGSALDLAHFMPVGSTLVTIVPPDRGYMHAVHHQAFSSERMHYALFAATACDTERGCEVDPAAVVDALMDGRERQRRSVQNAMRRRGIGLREREL